MKIKKSQLKTILILIVIAPIVFLYFVSGSNSASTQTNNDVGVVQGISDSNLPTTIDMDVKASGYSPNSFTIPAGKEITWNVKNAGASGCTSSLIARGLINGYINVGSKGETQTLKFTAPKPGNYAFSCGMGMIRGTIKAV